MSLHEASRVGCLLGLAALFIVGCSHSAKPRGEPPIALSVAVVRLSTNECAVNIAIANRSKRSLEFEENDLPWHIAGDAITVTLVVEDGPLKTPIMRTPMILDPIVAPPLILSPGEVKSEEVRLDRYYQGLLSALQRHEVTVRWVYKPRVKCAYGAYPLDPMNGAVTLPRT